MAEFEKMLRTLDREGIKKAAEFLLGQLATDEKAPKGRAGDAGLHDPDNGGKENVYSTGDFVAEAERRLGFMEAGVERRLQEAIELLPRMISDGRTAEQESAAGSRVVHKEDLAARPESYERMGSAAAMSEAGYAGGAAELSDFFRRDSRRYDKEFERY